ncbi:MAG: rod shape-determining protein MreC [Lachnospiraceae bacterium]|jgi:rod shape-determining protein MreC|nr:rod shape-determining protein MreC [Lachnospiraceae bacterium]MCI8871848.1 rod shape-determining protein MreC [Lachnospiraceae bacterium]GFI31656.1 cell shape-determining protein MreC [Lachnospiraceae bacterium]
MRRKSTKHSIPTKYTLLFLTVFCVIVMFVSFTLNLSGGPLNTVAGYVFVPMQKGINTVGNWFLSKADDLKSLRDVMAENKELQEEVDRLTQEINNIKLEQYELENLRELMELDQKYPSYEKVAARVTGSDGGNWFNIFTIDKGSNDGIEKDMNVIAGSGLVGIVIDTGPNYAKVRSIIDDASNVSGMSLSTADRCIINGNLAEMNEHQVIEFSDLKCEDDAVASGEQMVTSHISDKYLEGILIGYVSEIERDANNLTYSGTITPAVDFRHLQEVLVILDKKTIQEEKKEQ